MPKMKTKTKRAPRSTEFRVTAFYLRETMTKLALPNSQIAKALGVSPGTVSGWLSKNDMPKLAQVACECLRRRVKHGEEIRNGDSVGWSTKAPPTVIVLGGELKQVNAMAAAAKELGIRASLPVQFD